MNCLFVLLNNGFDKGVGRRDVKENLVYVDIYRFRDPKLIWGIDLFHYETQTLNWNSIFKSKR